MTTKDLEDYKRKVIADIIKSGNLVDLVSILDHWFNILEVIEEKEDNLDTSIPY